MTRHFSGTTKERRSRDVNEARHYEAKAEAEA